MDDARQHGRSEARERASALNDKGLAAARQGQFVLAEDCFRQAAEILDAGRDTALLAVVMGNVGSVFRDQARYAEALEWYVKALERFEELGNREGTADQHTNIGYILAGEEDFQGALAHYRVAEGLYAGLSNAAQAKAQGVRANIATLESLWGK
jgi:tetratricopeptide (TPR) repeat protein